MKPSPEAVDIITRKKLQYCRFADSNQWEKFDNIMLPDSTSEFFNAEGEIHNEGGVEFRFASREEFVSHFSKSFAQMQTIHMVSSGEMEQTSEDEMKVVWAVVYHAGTKASDNGVHCTGGGHYYETWKRQGDDWFMQSMRMNRLYWKVLVQGSG